MPNMYNFYFFASHGKGGYRINTERSWRRQHTMPSGRASASLVVAGREDTVAAQTCTTFAVDIAEHTSASSDRSQGLIDRWRMGSIAVSWQQNSCRVHAADTRAVRSRAVQVQLRRDRQSADSGTEARSCSCTAVDSRRHRMQRDGGVALPRVRPRVTHPR